jgi:hypothetical protein
MQSSSRLQLSLNQDGRQVKKKIATETPTEDQGTGDTGFQPVLTQAKARAYITW